MTKQQQEHLIAALTIVEGMLRSALERFPEALVVPAVILSEPEGVHFLQPAGLDPGWCISAIEWADGTRNDAQSATAHELPDVRRKA